MKTRSRWYRVIRMALLLTVILPLGVNAYAVPIEEKRQLNVTEADTTAPAPIAALTAQPGSQPGTVELSWVAPGDDATAGTASTYVVRYSTAIITATTWAAATDISGEPDPSRAGTVESMTVSGLTPGRTYYFAIKTQDEVPNTSSLSNSATAPVSAASTIYLPLALSGASGEPGIPTVIPETTEVLTETTTQYLSAISDDGAVFTFTQSTSDLQDLATDDVIVSDVSSAAPAGFLRKVVTVSTESGQVIVETEAATLEDAIEQTAVSVSKRLTPADIESMTAQPGVRLAVSERMNLDDRFFFEIKDVVLYDEDKDHSTTNDQLKANGSLELAPDFDLWLVVKRRKVNEAKFIFNLEETTKLEFETEVELASIELSYEIAQLDLGTITVFAGPVPIVFKIEMPIYLRGDGDVSVGIKTSVVQEAELAAGVHYQEGGWSPIARLDNEFAFDPPRLSAEAKFKGYIDPPLGLLLYGVAGPFAAVNPYLELKADVFDSPRWTLHAGVDANVGVKVDAFGRTLLDHEESVIGYKILLAQAQTNDPPAMPYDPLPAEGAMDQSRNVILSWLGNDPDGDAMTYDVYFEAWDWTPDKSVSEDQSLLVYDPGTLEADTDYYWRVIARDEHGATKAGPIWRFSTGSSTNRPPAIPADPSPADGAVDQDVNVDLSWTGGDEDGDTVTYDVYLDAGTSAPSTQVAADQVDLTYDPGTLTSETAYTWQVVAEDEHGITSTGPVWAFTTGSSSPCPITLTLQSPRVSDLTATVSGTVASDCSTITRLAWQWGDGESDDQWFPASHTYGVTGTYPITVTAYNDLGETDAARTTATLGKPLGEMITIPAGEFQMGCDESNPNEDCYSDEKPLHTVYLDEYAIGKYEVTNAQYAEFLNAEGNQEEGWVTWLDAEDYDVRIHKQDGIWQADAGYEDHPVVEVSWYGARAYAEWVGGRLPTEAEWEKAARGSSDTRKYPWGNEDPDCSRLNYDDCVDDTTPVGSYPSGASPYGVMDMAGNVWEWVNDWYDSDYYVVSPDSNPQGPASGTARVLRGGAFLDSPFSVRCAGRDGYSPDGRYFSLGFRVVVSP